MIRELKPAIAVDSLGKLNEWLAECGIPQRPASPHDGPVSLEWETWGFGFKFERGNCEQANKGYRDLIQFVAGALYVRFSDPSYTEVIWRVPPELTEKIVVTKLVNPDGSDYEIPAEHRDDYEIGDWRIPPEIREVDTGLSIGKFHCRLAFVRPNE